MNTTTKPLERFALIPNFEARISELANLAEPENWGYTSTPSQKSNPVLRNYIIYTFARVEEEGKIIIANNTSATWNTGLVTELQEPVYMVLCRNKITGDQRPWHFQAWASEGDALLARFPKLPEMAHYFDDPSCLVFDERLELRPNYSHIIRDNRERFPEPHRSMPDFQLKDALAGAINAAQSRVRRNYKVAIPQYYQGAVQILLPLCLNNRTKADLALVVERQDGFYRAATCLTLDMAYNNARQLARPDKDWLQP